MVVIALTGGATTRVVELSAEGVEAAVGSGMPNFLAATTISSQRSTAQSIFACKTYDGDYNKGIVR